ncbi:hypothetical protein Pelo_18891 [Pelomyxa schiedti]|nr:hypothetical protein Pelo_18891 [Pelomyxa schiedti]
MQGCLHQASLNGHCHVLSWLLSTFIWTAEPSYSQMIQLDGKKCTVSGLKGLIDKFPNLHHRLVPSVAYSRAPEDEVLQLCQQVKNGFPSLGRQEFLSSKRMPKHTRVIQWALSDVTSEETLLNTKWNFSCQECGDVELGKWFIEEKGVTPAPKDFIAACSGRHDNVAFVEWLFKKVGDSLTSDQLLECLHRALANQSRNSIALWLEQLLMTSTGRMPKISLSKLVEFHNDPRDTWLEWVLTHSGSCDFDCSQEEVAKAVGYIVATLSSSHKSSVAISLWKKFNLSAALNHDLFCKLLVGILSYGTSFHFKYVAFLGQLSPPELQQCMHAVLSDGSVTRVKAVKWLVNEINRGGGYVTEYEAGILLKRLIFNNKREAVQWLLNRDRIPLHYVLSHLDNPSCGGYVYLATWKVVLEMIPGITGDLIRQGHCVKVALKTPLHAQFTMSKLCLTHDDVERLCNNSEYSLPEIVDWLHHVVSTPRHSE